MLRVLLSELRELVPLLLNSPAILVAELLHHHRLHQAVVVSQDSELPGGHIQLVDQLAALLRDLGIDQLVDVAQELLALPPVVECLFLLHVEQVLVLVLSDMLSLDSAPELDLTILEQTLAENLKALVEVFHREHDTRATGQGLHFGAPVAQLCEERLDKAKLVHHVKVALLVHRLEKSRCKLLLGMHEGVDSPVSSSLLEGCKERGVLSLDHVQAHLNHLNMQHFNSHRNLCFCLMKSAHDCVLARGVVYALQNGCPLLLDLLGLSCHGTCRLGAISLPLFGLVVLLSQKIPFQ